LEDKMSQYRWMLSLVVTSTLGAVAATGCFVVDDTNSDDDDENAGEGGTAGTRPPRGGSSGSTNGGSSNGGSTSGGSTTGGSSNGGSTNGGSSTGGSTSGTDAGGSSSGGAPPTGGSGGGPSGAVMKFCNELYLNGTDVVPLTVAFAGVEATAMSGECTPVVPNACIPIPAGTDPSVVLMDDTGAIILDGSFPTLTIAAGEEILVDATVDELDYPTVLAGPFNAGFVCADTDPLPPEPLEARSAPYRLPFAQDARHGLRRSVSREARAALPAYRLGNK
jgi:hypothetical protein